MLQNAATLISMLIMFAVIVLSGYALLRKPKTDTAANLEEMQRLKGFLQLAAFGIVTRLQREYGNGTGALKLSEAVESLLNLIPENLRTKFDGMTLIDIIEDALADAKFQWEKNPELLNTGEKTNAVGFALDNGDSDYDPEEP